MSLEVWANGTPPRIPNNQGSQGESIPARQEDLIWAGHLIAAEDPVMISPERKGSESSLHIHAIWEIKTLLSVSSSP